MQKPLIHSQKMTPSLEAFLNTLGIVLRPSHPLYGKGLGEVYLTVVNDQCGCCAQISMGVSTEEKITRAGIGLDQCNIIKVDEVKN